MEPKIAVGLESTLDVLVTFPDLEKFGSFAQDYEGGLEEYVDEAYENVERGVGGEMPIDGRGEEAWELVRLAREGGAEVSYAFGGNGAQEAVTLGKLGSESIFVGGFYPNSLSKLSSRDREVVRDFDISYARSFEKYTPASFIFQAPQTNRYILTQGEGRRIEQLRPYLCELPDIIREINSSPEGLSAISLVGWQVLFGKRLSKSDFELTIELIEEVRDITNALLFTDAGGIGGLDKDERSRLCKIYSSFDVLSINGDEVSQISGSSGSEQDDFVQGMLDIFDLGDSLSTVWLHTKDYQATLSREFSIGRLEEAQYLSALSGLYKVEEGGYPTRRDLSYLRENRDLSERGLKEADRVSRRYGKEVRGLNLAVTPCYGAKKFLSTVGAGDVSAATYLYSVSRED